jgi:cytochrome c
MNPAMSTPIPHDLPLPLPAPEWLLVSLLVLAFLVHILFVNLMIGGSLLTVFFQWKGRKIPHYDRLAREIAKTITVNKSMAVVMGVAPLLLINTLYTVYFYTANALTGLAWILIIPLVTAAFLLTYLHKYSWDLLASHRSLHQGIGLAATTIFLNIPLIFLANINLMLFPDRWNDVHGFISALGLPNVWPRYFHFLMASLAVTGLFLVGYMKRDRYRFSDIFPDLDRNKTIKSFYATLLFATGCQFVIGPLVYVTLPVQGMSWTMNGLLALGIVCALPALSLIWDEMKSNDVPCGRHFGKIVAFLSVTVLAMASARHMYRDTALASHRKAVAAKTLAYQEAVKLALIEPKEKSASTVDANPGEEAFNNFCAACHAYDQRLVGPSIQEIQSIYAGKPEGIIAWVKSPGKKRPDYPQMPTLPIPEDSLTQVAKYILERRM